MKRKNSRLFYALAIMMTAPILALGIILVMLGNQSVSEGMEMEIKKSLAGVSRESAALFDLVYPEEIHLKDGHYFAGKENLTGQYEMIDRIKANTGVDITVFYGNVRVITTIKDHGGNRIIGTIQADPKVIDAVFSGEEYYSNQVSINGVPYFGYYVPLMKGKEVCGMLFAGVDKAGVDKNTSEIVNKIALFFILALIVILLFIFFFARNLVLRLGQIRNYIGELAENKSVEQLPQKLLDRKDEIGDMGRYAVEVGKKITDLITVDSLTGLLNRRAGQIILDEYMQKAETTKTGLIIAMADIDYFKQVNDQYGHKYGDLVLTKVAEIYQRYVGDQGFISRWGGEEFLFGFQCSKKETLEIFEKIKKEVNETTFLYEGKEFFVTITIGVAEFEHGDSAQHLVGKADKQLYLGKESGRNRIVY